AIRTLDQLGAGTKEYQQTVVAGLIDKNPVVRMAAAGALRKFGVEEKKAAVASVVKAMEKGLDPDWVLTLIAAAELEPIAGDALPALERGMAAAVGSYSRMGWFEVIVAIDPTRVEKWKSTLEEDVTQFESTAAARFLGQRYPNETKYLDFTPTVRACPGWFSEKAGVRRLDE
ncbi:MAG TPA: HEAT repeat domain-containing protein, partial [Candidatus Xenobia bacterium]